MDFGDPNHSRPRLIGNYILGPRIGSGSFAVVWRSRHRHLGMEVAVKEIDRTRLSPKVSENLLKEISILRTINHPNIIRLFDSIETQDRIYLVLEYCDGGDLAAYLHRRGKVSEAVARHFMRQLAMGLKVLQENYLIHRDLKPQNLLLSTNEGTPLLKIGDFGFARSLTPEGLADTLCGSPLYMAPEIIRNEKYDAKADLWSVGAILFQLMTGKPPFDGNNQLQLFQNVLASTELQFPEGALEQLHPDCVDLCRNLLRQNPVERLTFTEFFDHKFLQEPRSTVTVEETSVLQPMKSMREQFTTDASGKKSQFHIDDPVNSSTRSTEITISPVCYNTILQEKEHASSSAKSVHGPMSKIASDKLKKPIDSDHHSSNQPQVSDSTESIEKGYVLVNANFASTGTISYFLDTSLQDYSSTRVSTCTVKKNDQVTARTVHEKQLVASSVDGPQSSQSHRSNQLSTSSASTIIRAVQGLSILHPSTRLDLLHEYVQVLSDLAQEKYNAGLLLESFSVELVILAIWKKAFQICSSWLASTSESELPGTSLGKESAHVPKDAGSPSSREPDVDFSKPSYVSTWAEQGFIVAFDRAEKLSHHIQDTDAAREMPDAMEIIFQKALALGKSGGVDEYMENKSNAAALYSKAMLLLSFIEGEATSLPLNPPFSLTPANKKRIQHYILNLQAHQTNLLMPQLFHKAGSHTK